MISIIDCGGANLQSVIYAIDGLKVNYKICKNKNDIKKIHQLKNKKANVISQNKSRSSKNK